MKELRELFAGDVAPNRNALLKAGLRAGLSLAVLAAVYSAVELQSVIKVLRDVDLLSALFLLLAYTIGQFLSVIKWRILLGHVDIHRSFYSTLRAYFFGMFVNTVGLGTVGGDVTRAVVLRPDAGQRALSLGTVIVDRLHGLSVLYAIGAIALVFVSPSPVHTIVKLMLLAGLLILLFLWRYARSICDKLPQPNGKLMQILARALSALPRSFRVLGLMTAVSVVFHFSQIFMHLIIVYALHVDISILYLCAMVPFVNIASALPISVNGLGVREGMYLMFLSFIGLPIEVPLAFGAIWFAVVTLVGFASGIFLISTFDTPSDTRGEAAKAGGTSD